LLAHVSMLGSRCPTHSGASEGSGRREGLGPARISDHVQRRATPGRRDCPGIPPP
jgi:hypothetical protein